MILKAKERGNAPQLARYLLAVRDNDHVELHDVRGFISDDLVEAFGEADAIARGTRCEKHLFSMSFNPPEGANASIEDFEKAIEQVEAKLGLEGQPRAIVFHEKDGRRHAHAVWSRIDSERMRALNLNHYKIKLRDVSRQLFIEHGWAMPRGLEDRSLRDPFTFTREEWQQAQRAGLDTKELKAVFRNVWEASDNRAAFEQALKERGFWLAKGDRRGFVAVDYRGEVYAVARYSGVKAKDVAAKLGDPNELRSVDEIKADIASGMTAKLQEFIKQAERDAARRSLQIDFRKADMVGRHQEERRLLTEAQEKRWQAETRKRAERLPKGFSGIWHRLTGKYAKVRAQNEHEALEALHRDRAETDALIFKQIEERQAIERDIRAQREAAQEELLRLREASPAPAGHRLTPVIAVHPDGATLPTASAPPQPAFRFYSHTGASLRSPCAEESFSGRFLRCQHQPTSHASDPEKEKSMSNLLQHVTRVVQNGGTVNTHGMPHQTAERVNAQANSTKNGK